MVKFAWIAIVMLAFAPIGETLPTFKRVWRGMTFSIVAQAFFVLCIVFPIAVMLAQLPYLRWSWLSLWSSEPMNINTAPMSIWWLSPVFALLFVVNIPRMALAEEKMFRLGLMNWSRGLVWSVLFGLSHCLVGVPIGVGVALSLSGAWFTWGYFRGGLDYSTRQHTAYNTFVAALLLFVACASVWLHFVPSVG